jgi:hypothetical protein
VGGNFGAYFAVLCVESGRAVADAPGGYQDGVVDLAR